MAANIRLAGSKSSDNVLKLENQLCFPLYAAAKEVVALYKPYLDELDLTYTQYIAMMVLWENGQIEFAKLCEYLFLDSGTLTPLVKRLESKGFVKRSRDDDDERKVCVTLTTKGKTLKKRALPIPEKIGKCINLESDEAITLYKLLYKCLARINGRTTEKHGGEL